MDQEKEVKSVPTLVDASGAPIEPTTKPDEAAPIDPKLYVETKLQQKDNFVRECLAIMLTGLRTTQYGMVRLAQKVRSDFEDDQAKCNEALEASVKLAKQLAEEPFDQTTLMGSYDQIGAMLSQHVEQERKARKEMKIELMEKEGLEFPCKSFASLKLGGVLKGGTVLVLSGDEAVYDTMLALLKFYNRQNVPATHYTQADKTSQNVPGLRQVSGQYWVGAARTQERCKELFDKTIMGYVAYIDDLDALFPEGHQSTKERREDALKRLVRAAKRHKVAILVGAFKYDEPVRYPQGVIEMPVTRAKVNEQDGWMLGDEFFPKKEDGSELNFGDRNAEAQG
jgi:hypothetical protein